MSAEHAIAANTYRPAQEPSLKELLLAGFQRRVDRSVNSPAQVAARVAAPEGQAPANYELFSLNEERFLTPGYSEVGEPVDLDPRGVTGVYLYPDGRYNVNPPEADTTILSTTGRGATTYPRLRLVR